MKKLLLAVLTLISFISYSQTTGHLRYDSVRIYKMGGNAELIIESATRDSLGFLYNYGGGRTRFEVIRGVPGGIKVGNDTVIITTVTGQCSEWINPISVTYEGNYDFAFSEGDYTVDCTPYHADSISITIDSADATFGRFDVFYADETGIHVREGDATASPLIPSLEGNEKFIAYVFIPANSLPFISTVYIYKDNTEWTVAGGGTGATLDADQTTIKYEGTKAINWSNVNNGDAFTLTYSDTINLSLYDAISIHPRLKQAIPATANLRATWFMGTTAVSDEVSFIINKSSINVFQATSLPMDRFTINSNYANRLRIRFTANNATIYSGFYIDFIFLEQGLIIPGEPGSGSDITLTMPSPLFSVQNNNGAFTVTMPGSSSSIVNADGTTRTYDAVTDVGAYNSLGTNSNGAQVSGNEMIFHDGDGVDPGMIGAFDWRRFDTTANLTAESMGTGFPVIVEVTPFRTAFYSFAEGSGINIDTTGGTMTFSASGGAGSQTLQDVFDVEGGRALLTTNDTIDLENGLLEVMFGTWSVAKFGLGEGHWLNADNVSGDRVAGFISRFIGSNSEFVINAQDNINSRFASLTAGTEPAFSFINGTADTIILSHNNFVPISDSANYYMQVIHKTTGTIGKAFWTDGGGGGGGSGLFPTTGTGTATGNVIGDLDGNTLSVQQGGNSIFHIDPTTNNEHSYLRAHNITGDDNVSSVEMITTDIGASFSLSSYFNDGEEGAGIVGQAESGLSSLVFTADTYTFTGAVILGTGGTAAGTAFLYEQAGSLLTASEDGAHEYDGKARYFTTATGRGLIPTVSWSMVNADFPLSDVNTAQVCLPPAQDVITLQGGTIYEFEGQWNVICGTASHAFGMGFSQGGTGTLDTIRYNTIGWAGPDNNTASVQASGRYVNITPNTLQMAASAVGGNNVVFRGIIVVAPGDPITLTPQIQFSAAPGGTNIMKRGSYIKFSPIGSNTVTSIGNVN